MSDPAYERTRKGGIYKTVDVKELKCNQGLILRQREWGGYDEGCLGPVCPHPIMCPLKRREEAKNGQSKSS